MRVRTNRAAGGARVLSAPPVHGALLDDFAEQTLRPEEQDRQQHDVQGDRRRGLRERFVHPGRVPVAGGRKSGSDG